MKFLEEEVRPIHKFNGGAGATLCNACRRIISEGMLPDLWCKSCRDLVYTLTTGTALLERDKEPLVDPAECSDEDLRGILETDPFASLEYQKELDRRAAKLADVSYWEGKLDLEDAE